MAPVTFKSWEVKGYSGSTVIEVGDQEFIVSLALDLQSPVDAMGGEGKPDVKLLKSAPVKALSFRALELNHPYTLHTLTDKFGEISSGGEAPQQYFIAKRLKRLVEQEGGELPFDFEITQWETLDLNGESVTVPVIHKVGAANFASVALG